MIYVVLQGSAGKYSRLERTCKSIINATMKQNLLRSCFQRSCMCHFNRFGLLISKNVKELEKKSEFEPESSSYSTVHTIFTGQ